MGIHETQRLMARITLVEALGRAIHCLQWERGVSSLYLSSGGLRFADERGEAVTRSQAQTQAMRALFDELLYQDAGVSSRMLSIMAWVMLDLDNLPQLRDTIAQRDVSAHDAMAGFSRVIAGLIELIFYLADGAGDPAVSRLLVALVYLVQAKETAGQERAVGCQLFASGVVSTTEQQRVIHLIEAQEHAIDVFLQFAEHGIADSWNQLLAAPNTARIERLRRTLCTTPATTALDITVSTTWFDVCSQRMNDIAAIETSVVQMLRQACTNAIQTAQDDLDNSKDLLQKLRDNPPQYAQAVDRYYRTDNQQAAVPVLSYQQGNVPIDQTGDKANDASVITSLKHMLQEQSGQLAKMELDLDKARQALNERKIIERAKGVLMAKFGMTEDVAFRTLQKAAMDQNKRLVDMARATLAVSDFGIG